MPAAAAGAGGATYASGAEQGGAEYGAPLKDLSPPVATRFVVSPAKVVEGATPPRIAVRIDDPWSGTLRTRVVFTPSSAAADTCWRSTSDRFRQAVR